MDLIFITGIAAVVAFAGTFALIRTAGRLGIVDRPGARSSHSEPKPHVGGIAVMAAIALAAGGGGVSGWPAPAGFAWLAGAVLFIALVSLIDDLRDLSPLPRFCCQAIAVAIALAGGAANVTAVSLPLPAWAIFAAAGLAWLWFVNLYNFMDGIDGITATETVTICIGIILVANLRPGLAIETFAALIIGAAVCGFAVWNWHPSKIFLGDVGAVPLGFMIGWLLLSLAAKGAWAAALILPAYYLADATITLLLRAVRGEKVWRAHKSHFYQRAHQGGLRHDQVVLRIAAVNVCLIGLALAAEIGYPAFSLPGAVIVVGVLMAHFHAIGGRAAPHSKGNS